MSPEITPDIPDNCRSCPLLEPYLTPYQRLKRHYVISQLADKCMVEGLNLDLREQKLLELRDRLQKARDTLAAQAVRAQVCSGLQNPAVNRSQSEETFCGSVFENFEEN